MFISLGLKINSNHKQVKWWSKVLKIVSESVEYILRETSGLVRVKTLSGFETLGWFLLVGFSVARENNIPAESAHFIVENPILHLCSIFLAQNVSAKLVKTCRKKKCSLREAFCGENWTTTTKSRPEANSKFAPSNKPKWPQIWKLPGFPVGS